VRVLRVARFAARFAPLGFRVAPETLELMRAMVERGEVDALVPERVWQETEKALREPRRRVLPVLRACGALRIDLSGNRRAVRRAAAGRNGIRRSTPACTPDGARSSRAAESDDPKVRFAALVHDLGKGTTPPAEWPSHRGHEERSVALIERWRRGCGCRATTATSRHRRALSRHRASRLRAAPATMLEFLERADAFRRPERFAQALLACEADSRGRLGNSWSTSPIRSANTCRSPPRRPLPNCASNEDSHEVSGLGMKGSPCGSRRSCVAGWRGVAATWRSCSRPWRLVAGGASADRAARGRHGARGRAAVYPEGPLWRDGKLLYVEYAGPGIKIWDGRRVSALLERRALRRLRADRLSAGPHPGGVLRREHARGAG
jgi:hypothetical protein